MKITAVETVLLTGPSTNDPFFLEARNRRSAAIIRIVTDAGVVGLGESYAGYFIPEAVPGIVEFFQPVLLGRDPLESRELWARMYHCGNFWCRTGLGAAVLGGIDAALWDIRGKAVGLPVYRLLAEEYGDTFHNAQGFCGQEKVRCYATGGPSNYPPERLAAKVEHYLKCGFHAVKLGAGSYHSKHGDWIATGAEAADFEAEKSDFLRRNFGRELTLLYDGHMGNSPSATWDLATAQAVLAAQAQFDILFYEEPLHYTRPDWYAALRQESPVPVAGGECLTALCDWRPFLDQKCLDVGQPDASFLAGIGEFMQVAALLSHQGAKLAPHAWGAGLSQMQNIHCAFASPNTLIAEVAPDYGPLHALLIGDSLRMENGVLLPPERPGWGVDLPDEVVRQYAFVPGSGEFNEVPGKLLPLG